MFFVDDRATNPERIGAELRALYNDAAFKSGDYETVFAASFADDVTYASRSSSPTAARFSATSTSAFRPRGAIDGRAWRAGVLLSC